ncbi:hypothetical protein [Viridibacillus arvi]|uniref:hypothetical protein n=1 Tax=Viridibacillus arvi TaxID=263475 RepID=UPI0034CDF181
MGVHQLNIFNVVGEPFEIERAKYNKSCDGTKGCLIKAYIPKHVIFPGDPDYTGDYLASDPWLQYVAGMDRANQVKRRKERVNPSIARDKDIPVELVILQSASFYPEFVIEY